MLTSILSIGLFTVLAMLIHELGHLLLPDAVTFRHQNWQSVLDRESWVHCHSVRFNLQAIPLGSFVRLDGTALRSRSVGAQLCVHLGGIVFNLIAGFAAFGTVFGWLNLLVAAGNILPIYQHDGWKCGLVLVRAFVRRQSQLVEWAFTFSGGFVSLLIAWAVVRLFTQTRI